MYRLGATLPSIVAAGCSRWARNSSATRMPGCRLNVHHHPDGLRPAASDLPTALPQGNRPLVLRGGYRISHFTIPLRSWTAAQRSNAPVLRAAHQQHRTARRFRRTGSATTNMRTGAHHRRGRQQQECDRRQQRHLAHSRQRQRLATSRSTIPPTAVQDWNFTLEKEVMANTVVRASYVGNHTGHLEQVYQ